MNEPTFTRDVFLSRSAKDKAMVPVSSLSASTGERAGVRCRSFGLSRADGASKFGTRNLEFEIVRLCMSANAFGSDWAQLESGTLRTGQWPFHDPLNKERRFLPLRLDDAMSLMDTYSPIILNADISHR